MEPRQEYIYIHTLTPNSFNQSLEALVGCRDGLLVLEIISLAEGGGMPYSSFRSQTGEHSFHL